MIMGVGGLLLSRSCSIRFEIKSPGPALLEAMPWVPPNFGCTPQRGVRSFPGSFGADFACVVDLG